jgi:hypothetical protein
MHFVLAKILDANEKFQSLPNWNEAMIFAFSFGWWVVEARLAHYEIRFQGPEGVASITWDVDRVDDLEALRSALDVCRNQSVEVWEGPRKIAAISLSAEPHITL